MKRDGDLTALPDNIPVSVDKSHIIALGEKLYAESIELIRELVNNAYDADASEVQVTVEPDRIVIEDNGSGMNYEGLVQYFNIGSPEKRSRDRSPRFNRVLIGQFGIGKFASLAAARQFAVLTRCREFAARVIFDKEKWAADKDTWHLPLELVDPARREGNGTTVTLTNLSRSFDEGEVEQRLLTGTPLRARSFKVFMNGRLVTPRSLTGIRLPVLEGTPFGAIHGEVVIVPTTAADPKDLGIEVRVKGVMVKRDLFGMERFGKEATRVRGELNADFLPVTSDRTGFILDSEEYRSFRAAIDKVVDEVGKAIKQSSTKKESRRSGRAVKEALQRIHRALARNPDFSPFGPIPYGEEQPGLGGAAVTGEGARKGKEGAAQEVPPPGDEKVKQAEKKPKKRRRANPLLKRLTPNAVVRRMRFGKIGVSCVIDHFGEAGPEVFSEENVIYINADHPLYRHESSGARSFTMNMARLLAQEIALMQAPRNPRKAFDFQSRILREAFND